ncbi:MAG: outer membrane protein OmpA-like peptidoglycan-associated protein [Saprospiraceae bacterium]|jgi:outer membrane protein OmpA-like peptidoglycan-associated protein/tetratricopeptide (TPR) repeat protein
MRHLILLFVFVFVVSINIGNAQKDMAKQANKYLNAEKYEEALKLYNQVNKINEDKYLLFKRGVANYYSRNADDAVRDFTLSRRLGYEENDIYLYAAMALHSRGSYLDAVQFYKNYLRYLDDKEKEYMIVERIKQCMFAYNNQYNDQLAFVENLGSSVNTEYDELNPIQSPTSQNKYYFSSNRSGSNGGLRNKKGYKDEIYGKYSSDMYAVELENGNWTSVSSFHPILNGPKHELIQGFNPSGSVLYFLKTKSGNAGEIYADTFSVDKDPEAFPQLLRSPVISELGDKDIKVFNDQTIIFSSKRTGGFGGYDLYVTYLENDAWTTPTNLGPEINSQYDEVSPFLSKSGKKLFFSSDRIEGFGGFDIFEANYISESISWNPAQNVGTPINSPLDDNNFSLSFDGMTAIFSSNRIGTLGGHDLYLAYYKNQVMDQLMYTENLPFIDYEQDSLIETEVVEITTQEIDDNKPSDAPIVKKDFYNEPLYYGSDEIIVSSSNKSKLDKIKNILTVYPKVSVVLTGHSIAEGMREFDLYFSIKRAEKAAQYLMDNGIDIKRIKVRGLGSNFPHTKHSQTGSNRLSEKNNRRIDVSFIKVPSNRLNVINEMPPVADAMRDGSSDEYYNTLKGLAYKIEVAKTKQMFKGDVIRQYESGVVEKEMADSDYTYTVGIFDAYKDAKQMKSILLRSGIVNAKVIPYMNDVQLNMQHVEDLKDVYPDLGEFLRFER